MRASGCRPEPHDVALDRFPTDIPYFQGSVTKVAAYNAGAFLSLNDTGRSREQRQGSRSRDSRGEMPEFDSIACQDNDATGHNRIANVLHGRRQSRIRNELKCVGVSCIGSRADFWSRRGATQGGAGQFETVASLQNGYSTDPRPFGRELVERNFRASLRAAIRCASFSRVARSWARSRTPSVM